MSKKLGARLQAVRKPYDLTQGELAKRSGVTNATISLIETTKVCPSLSSLKKILDGIPMSLADFFTFEAGPGVEQVFLPTSNQPDVGSGLLLRQSDAPSFSQCRRDRGHHCQRQYAGEHLNPDVPGITTARDSHEQ